MGDAKAAAPEVQGQPGGDETFKMQQLGAMEQPSWSEGRLDDLNRRVDNGIGRLDDERKELRAEMKAGFERVDEEFKAIRSEMKAGFERMDAKFDRLTWSLLGAALAIVVALIGAPQL